MSLIKDPSGSFYLESDQFNVDYEENSIFITNDKLPVIATMSVAGIVKQAEAVNDATDDAIKTINELLANLRKAGILYETR